MRRNYHQCLRCEYAWLGRHSFKGDTGLPKRCPSCRSKLWNTRRFNRRGQGRRSETFIHLDNFTVPSPRTMPESGMTQIPLESHDQQVRFVNILHANQYFYTGWKLVFVVDDVLEWKPGYKKPKPTGRFNLKIWYVENIPRR